jgi:hypothetical protein
MRRASILTILVLCVSASQGFAQRVDSNVPPLPPAADARFDMDQRPAHEARQDPSLKSRVGRMFTGAVVGGWVGYFASHVVISDWENRSGITSYRGTWAAGGVAVGAIAGRLVFGGGAEPPDMRPTLTSSRQFMDREEILNSGATDAYQLVRSLRKEWLIPRGVNSFRETARGIVGEDVTIVEPGADHVLVYLDNALLGGTQTLSDIGLDPIGRIEFISASEATYRWGTGHAHGVIQLTTLGAEIRR